MFRSDNFFRELGIKLNFLPLSCGGWGSYFIFFMCVYVGN